MGRETYNPQPSSYTKDIHFTSGAIGVFYQLGISRFLKERYEVEKYHYSGVSAGSWCSMFLASDIDKDNLDNIVESLCGILDEDNFWVEGPFAAKDIILNTEFNIDYSRVKIGITQFNPFPQKKYVNNFRNKNDVLEACIASSHIPILSGNLATKYNNSYTMDGAIVGLGGVLESDKEVIISFAPDIWGKEFGADSYYKFNKESALEMYKEGYRDTKQNRHCLDQFIQKRKNPKNKSNPLFKLQPQGQSSPQPQSPDATL